MFTKQLFRNVHLILENPSVENKYIWDGYNGQGASALLQPASNDRYPASALNQQKRESINYRNDCVEAALRGCALPALRTQLVVLSRYNETIAVGKLFHQCQPLLRIHHKNTGGKGIRIHCGSGLYRHGGGKKRA